MGGSTQPKVDAPTIYTPEESFGRVLSEGANGLDPRPDPSLPNN